MTAITVTLEESIITVTPIVETQTIIVGGGGSGSGAVNLNGLADVIINTPTTGQVLRYDGTVFGNNTLAVTELSGVVITTPTIGQVLKYDGTNFINDTDYSVSSLDNLSDVTITTPTNGQVLKYNGSIFVNATDYSVSTLDDLSDVVITTPSTGQVLKYNGTQFVNATDAVGDNLSLDNLTDVVITAPTSGQVLKFNGANFINDTDYSVSALNDLSDVTLATLEVGQVLKYDGIDFKNAFDDNVLRQYVNNASGITLLKGEAVYVNGSQGQRVTVSLAQANAELTSSKTIGIVQSDILANQNGYIVTEGMISNIDTSGATSEGDAVYLSPTVAGGFVYGYANHPVAPNHLVYIGIVVRKHASTGSILIKVQNGFEVDELHDVLIVSPTDKQVIGYDAVTSLWKNTAVPSYELFTEPLTVISTNKIQLTYKPEGSLVLNMAAVYDTNSYSTNADLYNNLTITNISTTYYATFDGSVTTVNGKYGSVSYLRRIN